MSIERENQTREAGVSTASTRPEKLGFNQVDRLQNTIDNLQQKINDQNAELLHLYRRLDPGRPQEIKERY